MRHNDIDLEPDKLGGYLGHGFGASFGPSVLDRNVPILDPAKLTQATHKSGGPGTRRRGCRSQNADGRQLRRPLSMRSQRPADGSPDERDELAPLQLSDLHALPHWRPGT